MLLVAVGLDAGLNWYMGFLSCGENRLAPRRCAVWRRDRDRGAVRLRATRVLPVPVRLPRR
jgi:hypothetical protein